MKIENLTNHEIIDKFKKAQIYINEITDKGSHKGMISTVTDKGLKMFPTYYTAFYFYKKINLIS